MEIRIIQNDFGQYKLNWPKSTSFILWIFDDWKLVSSDDNCATLNFTLDWDNREYNRDLYNYFHINELVEEAKEYAKSIISSTDYKWNINFFISVFNKNKDILLKSFKDKKISELKKQIKKIENISVEEIE